MTWILIAYLSGVPVQLGEPFSSLERCIRIRDGVVRMAPILAPGARVRCVAV